MIYKIEDIFNKLERSIETNTPFSLIRFGDGGLKLIHSLLTNDIRHLSLIVKKEGLPKHSLVEILELWGYYARRADFIDCPKVYYNGKFWPRIKRQGTPINSETDKMMRNWLDLYQRAEFDNENYCNPESNCLMILRIPEKRNLLDIMKGKKICCITAKGQVKRLFPNMDIISIVGQWQNQYEKSFKKVVELIKNRAQDYDFWLVCAGELGRIYSGIIKECGGRSVDIGFVAEYWHNGYIHPRFEMFLRPSLKNKLELILTDEGKKYEQFI